MQIKTSYNGWSGRCRSVRGTLFYNMLRRGEIEQTGACVLCGISKPGLYLNFHAEEYGPTWEDYVANTHEVCCHCHGMLHVRYRFPRAWKIYINAIHEGLQRQIYYNMGAFFNLVKELGYPPICDLHGSEDIPLIKTGNVRLDNIPLKPYHGEHKVPGRMIVIDGVDTFVAEWACLTDEQREQLVKKVQGELPL